MSRLFMLLAIVIAVYLLVKSYRKGSTQDQAMDPNAAEDMVRCAQCGVHLPRSESILAAGNYFCSAAHRDVYRK